MHMRMPRCESARVCILWMQAADRAPRCESTCESSGGEWAVLRGLDKLLRREDLTVDVVVELSPKWLKLQASLAKDILAHMSKRGFHAYVQQFPLSRGPRLTAALPLQRALYLASGASRLVAVNFWLGDGGLRSALHYDPHDNLLVQLRGAKTLLLFPPKLSAAL